MDVHWVAPHLALGAKVAPDALASLGREHGVTAVVDLRDEDCDDADVLARAGIDFLHLPTPDRHPPSVGDLDRGVAFVRRRLADGGRVLIHCEHGVGRSAVLALCVLCDAGEAPLDALIRAKDAREAVSPSPDQFEGWRRWLRSRGIEPPDAHAFGCIAYRHLAQKESA